MTAAHLRSYKVSGVARGHQQAVVGTQLLSEAKVTDPDGLWVPRLVNIQDVAGLQVSVHHLQDEGVIKTVERSDTDNWGMTK